MMLPIGPLLAMRDFIVVHASALNMRTLVGSPGQVWTHVCGMLQLL